ncbi:hypothetical protein [Bacillus sp. SG-1]|uniref:hypothetical protein n=1 Tax=Bacillus sp. SG-1 TaxID=161544 RepID=UPI000154313C|nr:hypothetical protein [Bacillus sp. SG-1]EDL65504.1 hypothetical protein BSG1_00360 [Bacillus sp. SG-1]
MVSMPNYTWYILLSLIALIILFSTFIFKNHEFKRVLSVYFFISGLSFILDFIILICFNAYAYTPGVFDLKWLDNVFGSFTSQGLAVPSAAVFLAAFQLNWVWIFIVTAVLAGAELTFLHMDIYHHYWWSTIYTALLLPVGFRLARVWYTSMLVPKKAAMVLTIYLGLNTYAHSLKFFMVSLSSSHYYRIGVFEDPIRDSIFGNSIYLFFITILMALVIVFYFKWYWGLLLVLLECGFTYMLVKSGIMVLGPQWHPVYFCLLFAVTLLLFRWIYIKIFVSEPFFI